MDEFFGGDVVEVDGDAEAAGDLDGAGAGFDGGLGDGGAEIFGAFEAVGERAVGENDDELFTAVAAGKVVGAGVVGDALGDFLKDGVADEMAMAIVDGFEVIDVGHEDGDGEAFALGAEEFFAEGFEDGAAVEEAGEAVAGGLFVECQVSGLGDLDSFLELGGALVDALLEDAGALDEVADAEAVGCGAEDQDGDNAETAEEIGLPEMGAEGNLQGGGGRPVAFAGGSLDFKAVVRGRKLGVEGLAALADVDPIGVGALEPVAKVDAARGDEVGGGELNFKIAATGAGGDLLAEGQGFVIEEDVLDQQGRDAGADLAVGGIDGSDAGGGGEPESAGGAFPD